MVEPSAVCHVQAVWGVPFRFSHSDLSVMATKYVAVPMDRHLIYKKPSRLTVHRVSQICSDRTFGHSGASVRRAMPNLGSQGGSFVRYARPNLFDEFLRRMVSGVVVGDLLETAKDLRTNQFASHLLYSFFGFASGLVRWCNSGFGLASKLFPPGSNFEASPKKICTTGPPPKQFPRNCEAHAKHIVFVRRPLDFRISCQ
jgi:hypothetical protein